MQESDGSDLQVKMKIHEELLSINAVVSKIKQELREINDIVQTGGSLDLALGNAIDSLTSFAAETGIVLPGPIATNEEQNPMANALSRITTGYITEKLKVLSSK